MSILSPMWFVCTWLFFYGGLHAWTEWVVTNKVPKGFKQMMWVGGIGHCIASILMLIMSGKLSVCTGG